MLFGAQGLGFPHGIGACCSVLEVILVLVPTFGSLRSYSAIYISNRGRLFQYIASHLVYVRI